MKRRKASRILVLLFITLCFCSHNILAQNADTASRFRLDVILDTFVIKSGFDVDAFIRRVQTDTTFYKAFKSLHFVPYTAVNDFTVYGKKGKAEAAYHSKTRQVIFNHCRTTK